MQDRHLFCYTIVNSIFYDEDSRKWSRVLGNGRLKPIQDPFEQANRNTHYLENAIKKRGYQGASSLPFTYGYAVVFPDCEYKGPNISTPPHVGQTSVQKNDEIRECINPSNLNARSRTNAQKYATSD